MQRSFGYALRSRILQLTYKALSNPDIDTAIDSANACREFCLEHKMVEPHFENMPIDKKFGNIKYGLAPIIQHLGAGDQTDDIISVAQEFRKLLEMMVL